MGMHDSTNRLHSVIAGLSRFYHHRHEVLRPHLEKFAAEFKPELAEMDDPNIDQPYYAYIQALSEGVDQVLAQLNVAIEPIPPGAGAEAKDELLMGGVRALKWDLVVNDGETGEYLGRIQWALYRRHDRFAVPGPAQITYLKARGGQTVMVG